MVRTRLFEIVDERGIRYRWLAAKMGYTPEYISRVKTGTAPITEEFQRRACALFSDVPADILFFADAVDDDQQTLEEIGVPA